MDKHMTLSEFLLARIEEDEAGSRAATQGPWSEYKHNVWATDPQVLGPSKDRMVAQTPATWAGIGLPRRDAPHIARHDPVRVLAECQAKRRIIERFAWTDNAREYQERGAEAVA